MHFVPTHRHIRPASTVRRLGGALGLLAGGTTLVFSATASAGQPNGSACASDADCTSNICTSGLCQSAGLTDVAEIQLDVGGAVLNRLVDDLAHSFTNPEICGGVPPFPCPQSSPPGQTCVLDQITLGAMALAPSANVATFPASDGIVTFNPVQIAVPINVSYVNQACLQNPNVTCAPAVLSPELRFDLAATVDTTGDVMLCATLVKTVALELLGVPLPTQPQCTSLSQLTAVESALGANVQQLAVSSSGNRLAVRLMFQLTAPDVSADPDELKVDSLDPFFNDGLIAPSPPSSDWSVFLGGTLIASLAQEKAFAEAQSAAASQITLTAGPPAEPWTLGWTPAPPTSELTISGAGSIADCDISAVVDANVAFALDTTAKQITIDGHGGGTLYHPGFCEADLLPGVLQIILAGLEGVSFGNFGANLFPGANCSAGGTLGSASFQCTFPSQSPPFTPFMGGPTLQATATQLFGVDSGLVIGGTLTGSGGVVDETPASFSAGPIVHVFTGDCTSQQPLDWEGTIYLEGGGQLCNFHVVSPTTPGAIVVTDPNPSDPNLPKLLTVTDVLGTQLNVPVVVEISTINGSGLVTLSPPAAPTLDQELELVAEEAAACQLSEHGWLGQPGKYDPTWGPYPPIDSNASVVLQSGLVTTGTVTLANAQFTLRGAPAITMADTRAFTLSGQGMTLTAEALVQVSGAGSFLVPVSIPFSTNLSGNFDAVGGPLFTRLVPTSAVRKRVTVPVGALPPALGGLSFTLSIPVGDLALYGFLPALDNACDNAINAEADGPNAPYEQKTCASGPGFTLADAVLACGGEVNYFTYDCADFPARLPYQPNAERAWTAYYGCCAGGTGSPGGQ